jgi:hypothetical protein
MSSLCPEIRKIVEVAIALANELAGLDGRVTLTVVYEDGRKGESSVYGGAWIDGEGPSLKYMAGHDLDTSEHRIESLLPLRGIVSAEVEVVKYDDLG